MRSGGAALALVAALALPLGVFAEPVADSAKSTEVSELVVRARKATELSGLRVDAGCAAPAQDSQWPKAWFDAPPDSQAKRTEESEGTRAFILRLIADVRNGQPDYAHMGNQLAGEMSEKFKLTKLWIICRGAFKDIKFLHVSQKGYDDFEVDFSNGAIEWEAEPLDSHQVEQQTAVRFYYPQPATKQFLGLVISMLRGQPNYASLAPDAASTLQAQWPSVQASFKTWHALYSLYFIRTGDDGSYIFKTGLKNRQVLWEVGRLDAEGRITSLKYEDLPD